MLYHVGKGSAGAQFEMLSWFGGSGVKANGRVWCGPSVPFIRMISTVARQPPMMWYWKRVVVKVEDGTGWIWVMALKG